jgi:DNA processing protein
MQYEKPTSSDVTGLEDALPSWRPAPNNRQQALNWNKEEEWTTPLYFAGDLGLLQRPCVAVVGTRSVSDKGIARAKRLARELVEAGVVVVSGLAEGVDTAAHTSAINNDGRTVAVIGTPLDRVYPKKNSELQQRIYREHLLISPFEEGARITKKNWPFRNKVMSALSNASVIVEAGESSGTVHQASACKEQRRPLLFLKSMAQDGPSWAQSFLSEYEKAGVLEQTDDVLKVVDR